MNIVIVSAVFRPEPMVSAQTSTSLARKLTADGKDVTVITTFPNRPAGVLYPGFNRPLFHKELSAGGYRIIRCFATLSPTSSLISRFLENISFGLSAGWVLLFLPKPDVIYSNTWPIFATGILMLVARLRRVPVVLSVQDFYPESLLTQGRLKENRLFYKFLVSIDRWIAKGCHTIIPISEHFARIYIEARGISPDRIKVIPNWVDKTTVNPGPKVEYRNEKGISEDAFVLVYGGNIGMAAGVETVIAAMSKMTDPHEVYLLVAGSGSSLDSCKQEAQKSSRGHVLFHSPWPADETSRVLCAADVLVLPTRGKQSLASVPSKMITYMLAGRPILALALPGSETAQLVQESECGWVIDPDEPEQLARKIEEIARISKDRLAKIGQSGRTYALQNFVSEICLPRVVDAILSAAKP